MILREKKKHRRKRKGVELSVFFSNLVFEILSNQRRGWTIAALESSSILMILLETKLNS